MCAPSPRLTKIKESMKNVFFLKKIPEKFACSGKSAYLCIRFRETPRLLRLPTEADRRYLKDLQYRQTVQEAGIFIPAARAAMVEDAWV